ncbi:hypothetical protein BT96DRAFT_937413 [Gymnopus androsaceus JB14]|uniref:SET domain-containing protein n=1 Tax=Gymnopus androsaceus JB14 TaxID=1447944 RepID=A0A6A4HW33_9AGAR|nr:hypothetical protein BT96DRAFT_937413 [Gymnopus androsaceus JB14]
MMNVNAIASEEFFGMRRRSSISNTNTATSTKQQQQRGNSPALSTKQQQQRLPLTPSRDISAGQASGSTAVRLVNGRGHEIDGNGTLLLSPAAVLEANGRKISGSGSGSVSVNEHDAGSVGGASGKSKSSARWKSLGGRSASPVASATSSGRQTAPHSSASASSSAGPSTSTIPAERKQPPSSASPTVPSASNSNTNDDPDTIRCICGYTNDDGWSIGCDGCGRWMVVLGMQSILVFLFWSRRLGFDESYPEDIIPQKETRDRLQRQAAEWRAGRISIVRPFDYLLRLLLIPKHQFPYVHSTHQVPLHQLSCHQYTLYTQLNLSHSFVAPFPSVITPSSEYLKDPLNEYAVLGMPKPKVHLMGPPLDVCLDARGMGMGGINEEFGEEGEDAQGKGKEMGNGPVLCDSTKAKRKHGKRKGKKTRKASGNRASEVEASASRSSNHGPGAQSDGDTEGDSDSDSDPQTLSFAIFALRDLKADEEVVLGWEWNDANVVHLLPALVEGKGVFPPTQLSSYKLQMANILHSLGATFPTLPVQRSGWRRGRERARCCVLRRMKKFVHGVYDSVDGNGVEKEKERELVREQERERARVDVHEPKDDLALSDARKPGPELILIGKPEQLERKRQDVDVEMTDPNLRHRRSSSPRPVATRRLSPRSESPAAPVPTRERVPGTGGCGGVEMDLEFEGVLGPRPQAQPKLKDREHAESLPFPPHMFPQYLPHPSFAFGYAYPPPHVGIPGFPAPIALSVPVPIRSLIPPNPSPGVNQSFISRTDGNVDLYWGTRPARAAEDIDEDGEVELDIEGDEEGNIRATQEHGLDEVEEMEVPPKMKRRSTHRKKKLHIADRTVSAATSMEVDQDHHDIVRAQNVTPSPAVPPSSSSSIPIPTISMTAPSSPPQISLPPSSRPILDVETATTSPLMSLANLSLLSPAIPIPASTSGRSFPFSESTVQGRKARSKPLTKDLWCDTTTSASGSFGFAPHEQERERSRSPTVAPRALPVDPLAALAAAAAAARPISPLPNRKAMQVRDEHSKSPGHDERLQNDGFPPSHPHSDGRDERYQSREPSVHTHDAVLGPGGIRVLSSPEHASIPLRRGISVSSSSGAVYDSQDGDNVGSAMTRDESSGPSSAHMAVDGFDNGNHNGNHNGKTSLEVKLEMIEEAAWFASGPGSNGSREVVIDLISSPTRRDTMDADSMQIDDSSIPAAANYQRHSHSPSPNTHTHRNSNPLSPSATNTDSYVAPLTPLSPPPQNLDDIPPWPASPSPSRSSASLRRGSPMSAAGETASPGNPVNERRKSASPSDAVHVHSMPSPMSALSSVGSSPAFNHKVALDEHLGLRDAADAAGDVTVTMMKTAVSFAFLFLSLPHSILSFSLLSCLL